MTGRRFPEVIARGLGLRPGEGGEAVLFFVYFFLITAPFAIVKSIRDASYLDNIGVRYLPWAYGTAVLVGAVVAVHARLQARLPRRGLLTGSLLFFAASAAAFRYLFGLNRPWITLLYWLWANIFVVVLTTQFWFLVNDAFDPRQAKRLVGFLGSGGILGGIAGGLATGYLARPGRPEDLLFAAAALLVLGGAAAFALAGRLKGRQGADPASSNAAASHPGFADSFQTVRSDSYLRLLAALALLAGIVSTFIDWQSKAIIDAAPAAKINLASFFGRFNAGLLAAAFLFQLALTGRFLRRFGLRPALMIYPLVLLVCSGGTAIWPVLGWALAVKGADKAFSYSIQQSSRELLYIPVAADKKYRAKIFIDMFLNRFAKTAGAGLLLLLFLLPGGPSVAVVGAASVLLIVAWLLLNVRLGKAYGRAVTGHLKSKWERGEALVGGEAGVETAQAIVDALASRERSPSLYALHLYELARDGRLTPEIAGFLEEERAALGPLPLSPLSDGEERPWLPPPPADLLAADADIREILALPEYQRLLDDYAGRVLRGDTGGETARMELAKAAGLMDPDSLLAGRLEDLLLDASPEVVHYAVESAGKLRRRESVPWLVDRLADPRARGDAAGAMARYGAGAAGTLGDYLLDTAVEAEVRRRIAAVLAAIPSQDTADALLDALSARVPGLERDLIDALDRVREQAPGLVFDPAVIRIAVEGEIGRVAAAASRAEGLWLFRLIGLLSPGEDLTRAGQCYVRGSAAETAFALELLDHVLPLDLKDKIVPVLERLAHPEEGA
ncbi:MAG: Npt1/Npt2 family nucleotide transporter [Acidobacteriota bacterium]|nr:Npt1/Npt2 family nucleotide transporter [Acidobacteriota bacterium]